MPCPLSQEMTVQLPDLKPLAKPQSLLIITIVLWVCFTLLAFHTAHGFNPDASVYISTAEIFNQHGLKAAFANFPRPFYPILIGTIHQLFGVSYFLSAHIFNVVAQIFIILGLFYLGRCLKLKPNHYLWLSILILISPVIIEARTYVVRDFGFLAAWIFGLAALIRYAEYGKKQQLYLYHFLLLVSLLFRSDALVLWLLVPCGLLFSENGLKKVLHCYVITLIIACAALTFILFFKHATLPKNIDFYLLTYMNLDSVTDLYHTLWASLYMVQSQAIFQFVDIKTIFICGMPIYFLLKILSGFNYVLSLFLLIGISTLNQHSQRKLFYWTIAVYALMLAVYYAQNLFFSSRYQAGMLLLFFIPAAYGMATIWEKGAKHIWLRIVMIVVLSATAIYYNWPKSNSRAYQTAAIAWLKQQTGVICSNQLTILFATTTPGQPYQQQQIGISVDPNLPATWQISSALQKSMDAAQCHWLALTLHQGNPQQVADLQRQLVQELHANIKYQTQNKSRLLWVFERNKD